MASNEYVNKVVLGNQTLIDLTGDDVTRATVLNGMKFHLPSGQSTTGTCTYNADTSDGTATAAEIYTGKIAYVGGSKIVGTMSDQGSKALKITDVDTPVSIPAGYHDGTGTAEIADAQKLLLIPGNIKSGVEVLGVTGTYSGETITARAATATPYLTEQVIVPGTGYDYLSQVTVEEITVTETDNAYGGKTVTIGAVAPSA